jgi:hypothetical protein
MKFRLLLWVLGLMMGKASRTNPALQQQLGDKDLAFQLQTLDGKVARHFIVKDQRITSRSGVHPAPVCSSDLLPHLTVFADQNVGGGLPPIAI